MALVRVEKSSTEGLAEVAIEAMELAVEMGDIRSLEGCFARWKSFIDDECDERKVLRLKAISEFLLKGRAVEQRWGQGSMLNQGHLVVKRWLSLGLIDAIETATAEKRPVL